ncbi:Cilia- and flagella-associated protein 46 [Lonchura striata]|uniref:Cilia-and flagella-associated protein 46 n=1 Tax=Lonchura striata TaxID=40157 RepID=A0A218UE49_9PASE|nr:Cilia- and flagella-associated protein 46 [Lonchura striata domestica]
MELAVREWLLAAESAGDVQALKNAYELIKSASEGQFTLDSADNISTDLYVLCAEQALQVCNLDLLSVLNLGYLEISSDCLQMYFKGRFPVNQFLGRAYLCQGQLHAPLSTDNLEEFEKFVLFFMKAIDFATHERSLSRIVTALNQIEEKDNEWRAELMIYCENIIACDSGDALAQVAQKSLEVSKEQGKLIEIECLECEYEMKKNGTETVTYTKGVVEAQLKLIKNLEVTLKHAVQLGDHGVIHVVCATQWNLCLPLLQHNLHQHVRKPLISVADVLEEIDSMLILLRCQVHMEIARIEEDGDRLEAALEHLQKAMHLNNSGQYQEHLRLSFNRLRLTAMLYESPEHLEDQAVMLIEQAKRGNQKDNMRKKRSLLVNAGLALAPDTFQIVLDSENEAKGKSNSQISYLCAKAQHHIRSVEKVDEHLKHLRNGNGREREATKHKEIYLFLAQKNKANATMMIDDQCDRSSGESLLPAQSFSFEADLLRILAEIRFINAEAIYFSVSFQATVHLLRLQGVKLNDHAVPPEAAYQCHPGCVSYLPDSDPEWKTYSLWIDSLSWYAMENFQRAAEIGQELNEAWIVHNAVVYILNYNRHVISSGRQRDIIEYLQTLLGAIKTVGHDGSTEILLMLCNALARGLIISWIPKPKPAEKIKDTAIESSRKAAARKQEKANIIQSFAVDPSGLPDIKAALEICEFALNAMTATIPNGKVSIAAQQQIIATWVKAKQLNQQQIRHQPGTWEENNDEAQNPLARILVGLEMYSCNGLGLMDFTVPSLSQLLDLTLECSWSDSLMELQTLTRLTYFAYVSQDYERVMTCSKRVLESDGNFVLNRNIKKYGMLGNTVRQEMLSITACIQGKSIMENLSGRKDLRVAASKTFVQSARHAGEAGNYSLVMFAARHFWNACLPLLASPHDREQFKELTTIILKNIIKAESKNKQVRISNSLIFKLMATVRAGSGCNFMTAIQKVSHESEDYLSQMWRHLVTVSRSIVGQLSCFQNAIIALQKQEDEWQRVDYLMEFAECLYCNQFPLNDAIKPLEWAVDLLLCMKFPMQSSQEEESNAIPKFLLIENTKVDSGANGTMPQMNLEDLSNIKQLEALFRAQTLMALFSGHGSSFHQQHCLMAYACIIRIWQVEVSKLRESVDTLPANVEEWAQYDCPNEIRYTFKQKRNSYGIHWDNFPKPLAEVIASEVLECRSLSDLYHLRIALICSDLKLSQASVYHEKAAGEVYISELEQAIKTLIQIHLAQDHMTIDASSAQLPHIIQEYYNKLVQVEKDFLHHGHKNYSAEILLERANICRMTAKQEKNKRNKHSHYLDAYNLAQRAVSKTEEVFNNICSLFALNESKNVSIPLMRQLALRKINLVEILLDIFHLVITEKKVKNMGEASFHEFMEEIRIEDDAIEQTQQRMAQKYLSQSSEALLQSVSVAFSHNVTDVLALASLEMAECFQQFDPISTSQFLALHQTPTENTGDSELDLISDFSEIIEIMEVYLKPTLSQLDFSAVRESQCVSVSAAETGKNKVKDKDTKQAGMQEASNPSRKIEEILEKCYDLFTVQWEGVIGNMYAPSQAEWKQLLTSCSAFLFYGMERFMSHVSLNWLVAMNITSLIYFNYYAGHYYQCKHHCYIFFPECHLVILLDLVRSQQSYQRIANSDFHKSCQRIALERPTETAILLSLTGVGSVIATQWYTNLEENAERLETLFEMLSNLEEKILPTNDPEINYSRYTLGHMNSLVE